MLTKVAPPFAVSAGTASVTASGSLVFSNSNNVEFGLSGSTVTASALVAGGNAGIISANGNTASLGTVQFSNGSGVTFGLTDQTLTASVRTDYQSSGDYLTTAMASNRGSDFVQAGAVFAGTNATGTIASNGISVSVGNYLTTARASTDAVGLNTAKTNVTWTANSSGLSFDAGGYAGTGFTSTTTAGTAVVGTNNTAGLSIGVPAFLTTADLSANSSNYVRNWKLTGNTAGTTSSAQGTDLWLAGGNGLTISGSSNTLSFSVGNYLTTARASTDGVGLNTAQTNVTWTVNSSGVSLNAGGYAGTGFTSTTTAGTEIKATQNTAGMSMAVPAFLTTTAAQTVQTQGITADQLSIGLSTGGNTQGDTAVQTGNRFVLVGTNGITLSQATGAGATTVSISGNAAQTNQSAIRGFGASDTGNTAGNTGMVTGVDWVLAGSNSITISQSTAVGGPNTLWVQQTGGGGANATDGFHQNMEWDNAISATTTVGLSTGLFVPLRLPNTIQWNNVGMIVSASLPATSCGNTFTVTVGLGSSFQFEANYSFANSGFYDLYLLSRGGGGSSTDIVTLSSTRNTVVTLLNETWRLNASRAGGGGALSNLLSNSVSLEVSFPAMTSATSTSVNAATTVTVWGTGYSSWGGTASGSSSTSVGAGGQSISIGSTYPATTAWSSNKLLQLNWGVGVVNPGLYWAGIVRGSSTSSSLSTANTNAAANRSYSSTVNVTALTMTAQLSYAGQTNTIASSLGTFGGNSLASLAFEPGHGTYSATYAGTRTYMNNAGQANGEIALSDINTNVSFFKPWLQFNSNRI